MFTLLPYQNLKTHLRKHPKLNNIQIGDAALIYCETGKALVSLGILPKHRNTCPEDAKTFLTSLGARLLIQFLDKTERLPEDVLTDAPSKIPGNSRGANGTGKSVGAWGQETPGGQMVPESSGGQMVAENLWGHGTRKLQGDKWYRRARRDKRSVPVRIVKQVLRAWS